MVSWFLYLIIIPLHHFIRDQIINHRPGRALRTMKDLTEFPAEFLAFVHEEARKEAQGIVKEKDLPRSSFSLDDLRDFSYKDQFLKLDSKLTMLCRMQNLERQSGGGSEPPRPSPIMLEKVQAIRFSEELCDFARFKHEFNKIEVSN